MFLSKENKFKITLFFIRRKFANLRCIKISFQYCNYISILNTYIEHTTNQTRSFFILSLSFRLKLLFTFSLVRFIFVSVSLCLFSMFVFLSVLLFVRLSVFLSLSVSFYVYCRTLSHCFYVSLSLRNSVSSLCSFLDQLA